MSQKFTHFAFIASFVVILLGLNVDQKQVSKFCSNSKTQTERNSKLKLQVDFSTTIKVLGSFVESIIHKLLSDNGCCSNSNAELIKVKKLDVKCVS